MKTFIIYQPYENASYFFGKFNSLVNDEIVFTYKNTTETIL